MTTRTICLQNYVEPPPPAEEPSEEPETPTTPTSEETQAPPPERKTNYQKVAVTEVESCCHFWAQLADQGIICSTFQQSCNAVQKQMYIAC